MILVADELVAQSVTAGEDCSDVLTLDVDLNRFEITLAVEDDCVGTGLSGVPEAAQRDATSLIIVSHLADGRGIEKRGAVTRPWATFAIPSPADAMDAVSETEDGDLHALPIRS